MIGSEPSLLPLPGPGFEPLMASDDELAGYGFPPRPQRGDPAFPAWRLIVVTPRFEPVVSAVPPPGLAIGRNRQQSRGHAETSRNWSGAVISAPYRAAPFVALFGRWTVPRFALPGRGAAETFACSTWIGFDGYRRQSSSLPQIGTVQAISRTTRTPELGAWWQWWRGPGSNQGPHPYPGFPVEMGDVIVASLHVWPGVAVIGNLVNVTRGQAVRPTVIVPPAGIDGVRALDAECILERPKSLGPVQVNYPLPDFEDVRFDCWAVTAAGAHSRDMSGARLIRMVHGVAAPTCVRSLTRIRRERLLGQVGVARAKG